jgi:hypothetical protein
MPARNKNILLKIPQVFFMATLYCIAIYKRLWSNSSRILKIRSGHGFALTYLYAKSEGFSQASLPAGRQAKPRWGFASGPARITPKPFAW